MRHFDFISDDERNRLFLRPPQEVDRTADRETLGTALGALLYTPAHRPGLAESLLAKRHLGLTAVVLCLEDSVADADLDDAEDRCAATLRHLDDAARDGARLPLTFVRVRGPEHLRRVVDRVGRFGSALAGFVLPKFSPRNAVEFLEVAAGAADPALPWWTMPVLETPDLIHAETRHATLGELAQVIDAAAGSVLCVRVGGTDLSGVYGLRRARDLTVYDIGVVRDCISDVVNVFGRSSRRITVSAPVYEHWSVALADPAAWVRDPEGADPTYSALIREVRLDLANGLIGKTIIHPSQVGPVNALSMVDETEWLDAERIVAQARGGVERAASGTRMNEPKPHQEWARRTLRRAHVYGVRRRTLPRAAGLHAVGS